MSSENYNALFSGMPKNLPRTEVLIDDIFPYENQPLEKILKRMAYIVQSMYVRIKVVIKS